ncbi:putative Rho GTPase-activating protein domain, Rho GTPase activation protein [Trachipleistophora hominis]|uniref:Putative Rho GTPase-activating protein domain, Rho GTPase activation protein n=1 Tax=Trachipleistophora hominis TaxID=72359 RepID=L7JSA2_TRAHO|nr:putative Rho GTPase-activating protein domain, Rho GTPase activation protein [Trachipleistophora hominis]
MKQVIQCKRKKFGLVVEEKLLSVSERIKQFNKLEMEKNDPKVYLERRRSVLGKYVVYEPDNNAGRVLDDECECSFCLKDLYYHFCKNFNRHYDNCQNIGSIMFCECYLIKLKKQHKLEQRIIEKVIEESEAPPEKETIEIESNEQDQYINDAIKNDMSTDGPENAKNVDFGVLEEKLVRQTQNNGYEQFMRLKVAQECRGSCCTECDALRAELGHKHFPICDKCFEPIVKSGEKSLCFCDGTFVKHNKSANESMKSFLDDLKVKLRIKNAERHKENNETEEETAGEGESDFIEEKKIDDVLNEKDEVQLAETLRDDGIVSIRESGEDAALRKELEDRDLINEENDVVQIDEPGENAEQTKDSGENDVVQIDESGEDAGQTNESGKDAEITSETQNAVDEERNTQNELNASTTERTGGSENEESNEEKTERSVIVDSSVHASAMSVCSAKNCVVRSSAYAKYNDLSYEEQYWLAVYCVRKIVKILPAKKRRVLNNLRKIETFLLGEKFSYFSKEHVHPFMFEVLAYFREHGVRVQGLFRLPGKLSIYNKMLQDLREGRRIVLKDYNIRDVASFFKAYIREDLNGIIVPSIIETIYECFTSDSYKIKDEVSQYLPFVFLGDRRELLMQILGLYKLLAANKDTTNMNITNLAICSAPSFFPKQVITDYQVVVKQIQVIENLFGLDYKHVPIKFIQRSKEFSREVEITESDEYDYGFSVLSAHETEISS